MRIPLPSRNGGPDEPRIMNAASFASLSASLPPLFGASLAVRTLIEYLIIAGAVLLVTFAVLVWALVFRKPGKRRHSHHPPAAESHRRESKTTRSQSRRRRRKRRGSRFERC